MINNNQQNKNTRLFSLPKAFLSKTGGTGSADIIKWKNKK